MIIKMVHNIYRGNNQNGEASKASQNIGNLI